MMKINVETVKCILLALIVVMLALFYFNPPEIRIQGDVETGGCVEIWNKYPIEVYDSY